MKTILGISAFYHDSAATILVDGKIIAAAQEERFTRKKHDAGFPSNAILYCIEEANISVSEIAHVVFYEKPFVKFERLLETYLAFAPKGFKSFAMAIVGAEYVMRWLPKGTHEWNKFITPEELFSLIETAGLEAVDRKGFVFNPITWQWRLSDRDLSVNYVTASVKA